LRQTLVHAWERTLYPFPGPVHLNVPFRDPLAPITDGSTAPLLHLQEDPEFEKTFFRGVVPPCTGSSFQAVRSPFQTETVSFWQEWRSCERGVILAGPAQPADPQRYVEAVARLATALGWPVLAEGLSPLRNYASLNPYLITTYDLILQRDRSPALAGASHPTGIPAHQQSAAANPGQGCSPRLAVGSPP